ncbi:MAG: hypothetical protein RLQ25_10710 [Alphaproteobacteria bacterium]|uniref:hypothetical protein n=1 Tax=Marinobacter salarius TaxID=1420917 RepID=UPI0032EC5586
MPQPSIIDGRAGIEFGVTGMPESFVIDANGVIRYKQVGVITPDALKNTILPLIERLREDDSAELPQPTAHTCGAPHEKRLAQAWVLSVQSTPISELPKADGVVLAP